jgi:hypothetical protein
LNGHMRADSVRGYQVGDRLSSMSLTKIECGYVYHLIDPRDNSVRYVGSTVNPSQRYNAHITEAVKIVKRNPDHAGKKELWICDVMSAGLAVVMEIVEVVDPAWMLKAESDEYLRLVAAAAPILNTRRPNTGGWNKRFACTNASLGLLEGVTSQNTVGQVSA